MEKFLGDKRKSSAAIEVPRRRGSRFTDCPVCGSCVAVALINDHLDSNCGSAKSSQRGDGASEFLAPQQGGPPACDRTACLGSSSPWSDARITTTTSMTTSGSAEFSPEASRHARGQVDSRGMAATAASAPESRAETEPAVPCPSVPGEDPAVDEARFLAASLKVTTCAELPGLYLIEEFLSEAEEEALVAYLDGDEGHGHIFEKGVFNGPSRGKKWGVRTDLRSREFLPPLHAMPEALRFVAERMRAVAATPLARSSGGGGGGARSLMLQPSRCPPLLGFFPNEANALSYHKAENHRLVGPPPC